MTAAEIEADNQAFERSLVREAEQARVRRQLARFAPLRIVHVVGCGGAKLSEPSPARELYTSNLFRAGRDYAEKRGPWGIASAKHGWLMPDEWVEPYEHRFSTRGEDAMHWGRSVALDITQSYPGCRLVVVLLCGETYAVPIGRGLYDLGVKSETPLAGLQVGQRLHWFKERRETGG